MNATAKPLTPAKCVIVPKSDTKDAAKIGGTAARARNMILDLLVSSTPRTWISEP